MDSSSYKHFQSSTGTSAKNNRMTAKEKQKLKDAFLQCIENVLNALNVINHFNSFVSSTELNYQSLLQSFSVSKNLRLELQYLNCASDFIQFV